jgi:hypothetical protein
MISTINHLKKNESLINKQLCIIDSNYRKENENTSSFSNTLNKTEKRVCKLDIIDATISNTIYNIDNSSVLLDINRGLINGEIINEKIIVDDTEIKNNEIISTNRINGDVNLHNYITSNKSSITDIKTQGLFIISTGLFNETMVDYFNTDNFKSTKTISGVGLTGGFCACYNIDQSLKWILRLETTDISNIKVEVDESHIYIYGTSAEISIYDIDGNKHTTNFAGNPNGVFIFKCTYDGNVELVVSSPFTSNIDSIYLVLGSYIYFVVNYEILNVSIIFIQSQLHIYDKSGILIKYKDFNTYIGYVKATSIAVNTNDTVNPSIFISFDFDSKINYTPTESDKCNGDVNIGIVEYKVVNYELQYVGSVKIGGSSNDSNCILKILQNKIYLTGNFTSNPVVFYKNDKLQGFVLSNDVLSNTNIFIGSYDIDFITNNKTINYCFYVTSSTDIIPTDLKCKDNIFISCKFKNNIKFNDINGYVQANDINLTSNEFSQCIMSYSLDGSFRNRIYNTNSGNNTTIDINSSKLITYSNFTTNNSYYNVNSELSITLNAKDKFNSVIISFFNSNSGLTIDYEKLNKTLVCINLVEDEISLLLNINTFSENLGFEKSQKFLATSIGSLIPWDNIEITSENSILTLELQIANLETLAFDTIIITFKIQLPNNIASINYNPYNLIYELNKIFLSHKKNYTFLNQDIPAFYYDTIKKLFYIRLDIQGIFKVVNTDLSIAMNLNLLTSPSCVISDIQVSDTNDIVDNTKLTLKLTDNTNTEIVNSVNFSEVFSLVESNNLTIKANDSNIYADTGSITDKISNINVGDNITFEYPYLALSEFNYVNQKIKFSSNGRYVICWEDGIQLSNDYGNTFNYVKYFSNIIIIDADLSDDGLHIYVIDSLNIFVSDDGGLTFFIKDSERNWTNIKTASNTGYVIAFSVGPTVSADTSIYISYDYGNIWVKNRFFGIISNLQISSTGQYQICTENNTSTLNYVLRSTDYGLNWGVIYSNIKINILTLSGNGQFAFLATSSYILYSTNMTDGSPFFNNIGNYSNPKSMCISDDGTYQFILTFFKCIRSEDGGVSRQEIETVIDPVIDPVTYFLNMNISGDGKYVGIIGALKQQGNGVFISDMYGAENTYAIKKNYGKWGQLLSSAISFDGKYVYYIRLSSDSNVYVSNDYGITLTKIIFSDIYFRSISSSENGQHVTAVGSDINTNHIIYTSNNYGVDWVNIYTSSATGPSIFRNTTSKSGQYQIAAVDSIVFISNNYGITNSWVERKGIGQVDTTISVCISALGDIMLVLKRNELWESIDYGITWNVKDINIQDINASEYYSISISSNGIFRTLLLIDTLDVTHTLTSNDSGITWVDNIDMNGIVVRYNDIDETGKYQVCCGIDGLYKSSNYGNGVWEYNKYIKTDFSNISLSKSGMVSTTYSNYRIYINRFLFERINLNVAYIDNQQNSIKKIIFNEKTNINNLYVNLNNFNLNDGLNFTVASIIPSPVRSIYITPGDYTIDKFILQINTQIHEINPNFYYNDNIDPFIFNPLTKKITFNSYYIGTKENIIIMTNLLKLMGIIELPNYIINKITGSDTVDSNILDVDKTNIYISSTIINKFMVENTSSINNKLNKVLATLRYSSKYNSYKLINSFLNEIFLSQKASIHEIDIKILNNRGKIVNLNGGKVNINFNLIKS